jgi:superfamily I DNA/RNA helicase
MKEEGKGTPNFNSQQSELVYEPKRKLQRINGVAGSGKTTVLAGRAVQAHKRTGSRVLILTYNITLINYIKDKINQVREEFPWDAFIINNYHQFIASQLNNLEISFEKPEGFDEYTPEQKSDYYEKEYYSNKKIFEERKAYIIPYDTILIDEIQDYKKAWMDIIKEYFLAENGEYVLFGDIKQNIYKNSEIENKDVKTNVLGRPIELKTCFRADSKIRHLALEFQKAFFRGKYEIDSFFDEDSKSLTIETFMEREKEGAINYEYVTIENEEAYLCALIDKYILNKSVSRNDISILSDSKKFLKKFESYYRYITNAATTTMFERQELAYKIAFDNLDKLLGRNVKNNVIPASDKFTMQDAIQAHSNLSNYKHYSMKYKESANADINLNWFIEATKLIKIQGKENVNICLSKIFVLYELYEMGADEFTDKLRQRCEMYGTSLYSFLSFMDTYRKDINIFKKDLEEQPEYEEISTNKKRHFYMKTGTIKISTIHSFKGWECDWVFLVINKSSMNDELVYTGITRCRSNLIIINFGNEVYHGIIKDIVCKINN